MSLTDFELLVSECVPGPNPDPKKAEQMRCFVLPNKFWEPTARSQEDLTVTVLGAIVTAHKAYVISDYNRITRLHVVISSQKFTKQDILPKSAVSACLLLLSGRCSATLDVE